MLLPLLKKAIHVYGVCLFCLWSTTDYQSLEGQDLAAYQDNQGNFYIFDKGKTVQAEYIPIHQFSVGGRCLLYTDSKNNLKMYYKGQISKLEVNSVDKFKALDYLAVYSIGEIVKIIENGQVTTITAHAIQYQAQDSLVTFYDSRQQVLAVYYKGQIHILEDGLAGNPKVFFHSSDNLVAFVSSRNLELKVFCKGETRVIVPFVGGGTMRTGRDIVAYVTPSEQNFKVYYNNEEYLLEDFPPLSFQAGDDIVAYVDNTGSFKVFENGEVVEIAPFDPDFYQVRNGLIIYGEQGYFKTWYNGKPYLLETYIPQEWKAEWNTIVYRDLSKNVRIFTHGISKVLTYDLAEKIELYRDIIVVNKGMNNCNVYYKGKKY